MAKRFAELETEAARLANLGRKLTADNPVVRAFLADFEDTMRANQALLSSAAVAVLLSGVQAAGPVTRQMALPGVGDEALRTLGVRWNVPDPEVIARLVDYASSDAWAEKVRQYGDDAVALVMGAVVTGAINGWGPLRTAREMRRLVGGVPPNTANTLLRTLQLTGFRDAQAIHRVANADILEYQIRIAALDDSTCVACVALHGTILPLNARVDDHYNGRCTSITVLKGRPAPNIESGEAWFARLSPDRQRQQFGSHAAYEAWHAGKVKLSDFVQHTTDDVFGDMIREASLKSILGDGAKEFYAGAAG